jgi:NAD(P)H-hydrate epimerase
MKTILTPQQMKSADEFAIKTLRIPSLRLMEKAGSAVVTEIIHRIHHAQSDRKHSVVSGSKTVFIFCGKGNNGGDGFVVARLLGKKNFAVTVVLIESDKDLSADARANYERIQDHSADRIEITGFGAFLKRKKKKCDVIVDAMLGTSFRGELKGDYRKAVEWCNKRASLKIAVDIPTGLDGETGQVLSSAFRADVTVTISNPKIGFYRGRAKEFTGEVVVADIGIPRKAITNVNTMLVESADVQKTFPRRAINSHKHSVGKIFAIAGSKSMMGAALLCSQSAMRSGAGQVILAIPDTEYPAIAKRTLEVMPLGLPATRQGSIAFSAIEEMKQRIGWSNVVLLGCGMSRNAETQEVVREVIRTCSRSLVIDADGLNALTGHLDILKKRRTKNVVLTPHRGEFSRMVGMAPDMIEENIFSIASDFAKKFNVVLVVKGAPTFVAHSNGKIFVNSTGNPGMSTAGSGDVLAGIIASFIGQGNSALDASVNGVYIHGRAGDLAAEKNGIHGMIASDMIHYLPAAIQGILKQ